MVSRGESSESSPTRAHLGYVDGLRALAALYVLIGHMWLECFPIVYGPSRLPTGRFAALTGWMLYSHFAVSVFIVISGFCLALPVMRSGGRLRGGARRRNSRRKSTSSKTRCRASGRARNRSSRCWLTAATPPNR